MAAGSDPFRFDGEVALVTGASRGIGRGIAMALAERGARVVVNARGAEALRALELELREAGAEVLAVSAHAARGADAERLVAAAIERFGRIDVLINNAATNVAYGPFLEVGDEAIVKTFETNVFGPIALTRAVVLASMREHGGSIVNVASVGGLRAGPSMAAYGASKAALIQYTRALARELAPLDIRANAIAPSVIRTDFAAALHEGDGEVEPVDPQIALGRLGEVDEVVGGVVYLASSASSYVTGQVLVVDGGTLA